MEAARVAARGQVWGPLSVGARWWRLPRFPGDGTLVIDDDVFVFVAVDGLLAFCAERLADYKRPRELHVLAELPRNATGKVMKHRLGPG